MGVSRRGLLALGLLLAVVALSGCSGVVARVNGQDITRKEFYAQLEKAAGRQVLQTVILQRLLFQRAEAQGLLPTTEQIQTRFGEWKQETFQGDETKYTQWLKASGTDDTVVLDQIKLDLTVYNLRTAGLNPDEATLRTFFTENREQQFDKPERVSFRQVVVPSAEVANEIIQRLNTEGPFFEELVNQYSADERLKQNGGLQSEVPLQLLREQAKPLHDALVQLEPNGVTQQPVQITLETGQPIFVVAKLIERLPAQAARWEDPETQKAVKDVWLAMNAKTEQALMQEVMQGAAVSVLDETYKPTVEAQFTAGGGIPAEMQEQFSAPPELAPPTRVDPTTVPQPSLPGDAGAVGGN